MMLMKGAAMAHAMRKKKMEHGDEENEKLHPDHGDIHAHHKALAHEIMEKRMCSGGMAGYADGGEVLDSTPSDFGDSKEDDDDDEDEKKKGSGLGRAELIAGILSMI